MLEDDGAIASEVLVQDNAVVRASQQPGESMLALLGDRPLRAKPNRSVRV